MSAQAAREAVLLVGFGAPTRAEDVRPFLDRLLHRTSVPPSRMAEVERSYQWVGGSSPYNEHTSHQAEAIEAKLRDLGAALPVVVGMRNWHPFLEDVMRDLAQEGIGRIAAVILAPHRAPVAWDRYVEAVSGALGSLTAPIPEVAFTRSFYEDEGFIAAIVARVHAARSRLPERERAAAALIFTAHSIPLAMAGTSPYETQVARTAELVAEAMDAPDWSVAYQSRSGHPDNPWLAPDINDAIRAAAGKGARAVVAAPIGFLCDHVEVLFDLDVKAAETASQAGVAFARAETVGLHPSFIDTLARRALEALGHK